MNLVHEHIVPFLGISDDVFPAKICMVIPWMERGNIRHHLKAQQREGKLVGKELISAIDKWVSTALSLRFTTHMFTSWTSSCTRLLWV